MEITNNKDIIGKLKKLSNGLSFFQFVKSGDKLTCDLIYAQGKIVDARLNLTKTNPSKKHISYSELKKLYAEAQTDVSVNSIKLLSLIEVDWENRKGKVKTHWVEYSYGNLIKCNIGEDNTFSPALKSVPIDIPEENLEKYTHTGVMIEYEGEYYALSTNGLKSLAFAMRASTAWSDKMYIYERIFFVGLIAAKLYEKDGFKFIYTVDPNSGVKTIHKVVSGRYSLIEQDKFYEQILERAEKVFNNHILAIAPETTISYEITDIWMEMIPNMIQSDINYYLNIVMNDLGSRPLSVGLYVDLCGVKIPLIVNKTKSGSSDISIDEMMKDISLEGYKMLIDKEILLDEIVDGQKLRDQLEAIKASEYLYPTLSQEISKVVAPLLKK